ncbi:MAG: DUF4262 domain-containing protein, partial [Pseudonocardiaceae bacterium]
ADVEGDKIHPPWAYTLGLTECGLPELVVTGLALGRATRLLNGVAAHRRPKMICICSGRPMPRLSVHTASKRTGRGGVRCGEHDGPGDLDLAHGDVPPGSRGPIGLGQRQRQPCPPALAELPDRPRPQRVADPLQGCEVLGAGEPNCPAQ